MPPRLGRRLRRGRGIRLAGFWRRVEQGGLLFIRRHGAAEHDFGSLVGGDIDDFAGIEVLKHVAFHILRLGLALAELLGGFAQTHLLCLDAGLEVLADVRKLVFKVVNALLGGGHFLAQLQLVVVGQRERLLARVLLEPAHVTPAQNGGNLVIPGGKSFPGGGLLRDVEDVSAADGNHVTLEGAVLAKSKGVFFVGVVHDDNGVVLVYSGHNQVTVDRGGTAWLGFRGDVLVGLCRRGFFCGGCACFLPLPVAVGKRLFIGQPIGNGHFHVRVAALADVVNLALGQPVLLAFHVKQDRVLRLLHDVAVDSQHLRRQGFRPPLSRHGLFSF